MDYGGGAANPKSIEFGWQRLYSGTPCDARSGKMLTSNRCIGGEQLKPNLSSLYGWHGVEQVQARCILKYMVRAVSPE